MAFLPMRFVEIENIYAVLGCLLFFICLMVVYGWVVYGFTKGRQCR